MQKLNLSINGKCNIFIRIIHNYSRYKNRQVYIKLLPGLYQNYMHNLIDKQFSALYRIDDKNYEMVSYKSWQMKKF